MASPFLVKECALAQIATGKWAVSLSGFREILSSISANSIYHHFWARLLRTSFVGLHFHNDFEDWIYRYLNDEVLSERLGIIDPMEYKNLEDLRREILDVVDERIDELDYAPWCTKENRFHFLSSQLVIYATPKKISHPTELKNFMPSLSTTSIFYHFIDARRRTKEGEDDFSTWLREYGEEYLELIDKIKHVDPFFLSLSEQRQKLTDIMMETFL